MILKRAILFVFACVGFTVSMAQVENDSIKKQSADKDVMSAVITLSETEIEEGGQMQDLSGLLSSSKDPFVAAAGYIFGSARFRLRGYDSEYSNIYFNGVPVNDMITGRPYWGNWGGLNDAVRNKEVHTGIAFESFGFGNIGGASNIITRASSFVKGVKVSYSSCNRSYRNRLMATYATGVNENGFSLAASFSRRWANEGYVEGTSYDAFGYFLSAEQVLNEKMSLGLIVYGSPNRRGKSGMGTEEMYELSGNNYYNSYWGYQDGEVRNSRISNYHQPRMILTHYWELSKSSKLQTNFSYKAGRGGTTALNWAWGNDPRPDYYRKLPSYYEFSNVESFNYYTELWQNDEAARQINWDGLYFANQNHLTTIDNVYGTSESYTGLQSKTILEERRNDISRFDINTLYENKINENLNLTSGIEVTLNKTHYFKVVDDLLGGDFWFDSDKFADVDPIDDPSMIQNDLNNPNNVVFEGDVFGYDYNANVNRYKLFAQGDFTYDKLDFFISGSYSLTEMWREGFMKKGMFPNDSYGNSDKHNFGDYGLKGGILYRITGEHMLKLSGAYLTQAPTFRTAFVSPRTRNEVVNGLVSEKVMSGEASYIVNTNRVRGRLTGYYTTFTDQTWQRSFYHDDLRSFVNYAMTGVNKQSFGLEAGLEVKITPDLSINGMVGLGQATYTSDPSVTITADNTSEVLAENRTAYLTDYHVGGMPENIASVGLKYWLNTWGFGTNVNYFGESYFSMNPERRTVEAANGLDPDDVRFKELIAQSHTDGGVTLDAFVMKTIYLNYTSKINISLNVSNILDNQFAAFGYEQLRYDRGNPEKFAPRVGYVYGANYYLNISYKF